MSSYLLTFPILSTYKYFRHLHERETIPRNDIKVKGKPISRRDGKPFPYRINEYPVLGCCLCRYADITFVQAAEIRGIANQQAMTIPQILFQISSRPFFSSGPRRKSRMSAMLRGCPTHSAGRSGWLSRVAIHRWAGYIAPDASRCIYRLPQRLH